MAEQLKIFHPENGSRYPPEAWEAIQKTWESDLDGAAKVLEDKIKVNTTKGVKSLWLAQTLLEVRFAASHQFRTDKERLALEAKFLAQYEEVEKITEHMMDTFKPESTISSWFSSSVDAAEVEKKNGFFVDAMVAAGFSYLYKAVYQYGNEEPLKGTYSLKKSWGFFSDCDKFIKANPKQEFDKSIVGMLNMGIALFQLSLSLIPPVLQTLGQLVGFEANRENALILLDQAFESGCPRAVETGIILVAVKLLLFKDEPEANKLLTRMKETFPKSIILTTCVGHFSRGTGNLTKAIECFTEMKAFSEEKGGERIVSGCCRDIGNCYYLQNDYKNAVISYEKFLSYPVEISKKNYRPTVAFNLGMCYWMIDKESGNTENREKIIPLYKKAMEWIRDDESFDLLAKKKMDAFIAQKKFEVWEEISEKCSALWEGRQFAALDSAAEEFLSLQNSEPARRDFFAIYFFYKGKCLFHAKDYENAEAFFQKAIAEDGKLKLYTWIVPFSLFALGEIKMDKKEWKAAAEFFDKTKDYKGFDWEKFLSVLVYANKQTLLRYIPDLKL